MSLKNRVVVGLMLLLCTVPVLAGQKTSGWQDPEPIPKNEEIQDRVGVTPADPDLMSFSHVAVFTAPEQAIAPEQARDEWLKSVSVVRGPRGLEYNRCTDTTRLLRVLDTPEMRLFVRTLGVDSADLMQRIVNPNRAAFEAAVAADPEASTWTDEQLSIALRNYVRDMPFTPEELLAYERALADSGLAIFSPDVELNRTRATPECPLPPCCDGPGCGSCRTHYCDCATCPVDRECSCQSDQPLGGCSGDASSCNVDKPKSLTIKLMN